MRASNHSADMCAPLGMRRDSRPPAGVLFCTIPPCPSAQTHYLTRSATTSVAVVERNSQPLTANLVPAADRFLSSLPLCTDLLDRFGTAKVTLAAQDEEGSQACYGNADLLQRLAEVPIEEMPWARTSALQDRCAANRRGLLGECLKANAVQLSEAGFQLMSSIGEATQRCQRQ